MCAHCKFTLDSCCDLHIFEAPSGIYKIKIVEFDLRHVYCDMDTDDGGWIVIQRNKKKVKLASIEYGMNMRLGLGISRENFGMALRVKLFDRVW